MIYLASPYTHKDDAVVSYRYTVAEKITAKLLCDGMPIYSPIVHCHYIAKNHTLPTDFAFWKKYNFAMLSKADELYVLRLEGWDKSVGVTAEIEYAQQNNMKIVYIDPPL